MLFIIISDIYYAVSFLKFFGYRLKKIINDRK